MIRLARRRNEVPVKYTGKGLAKMNLVLLQDFYDNSRSGPEAMANKWKGAKDTLSAESHGKCAYCETPSIVNSHGDVEHFRPKSVYWWLAYCYDNYTFSCQLCNQKFKGAEFPKTGKALKPPVTLPVKRPTPSALKALAAKLCPDPLTATDGEIATLFGAEAAHLPHPYVDDPEQLFAWEVDEVNLEVRVKAKSSSLKSRRAAAAVEEFLGLNREELCRLRFEFWKTISAWVLAYQTSNEPAVKAICEAQFQTVILSDKPYAAMNRWYLRELGLLV